MRRPRRRSKRSSLRSRTGSISWCSSIRSRARPAWRGRSARAAKRCFDKVADEKSALDQWLLSVAEHGVKEKDGALAADAYARLLVKKPASLDPTRVSLVEQYLDAEFK